MFYIKKTAFIKRKQRPVNGKVKTSVYKGDKTLVFFFYFIEKKTRNRVDIISQKTQRCYTPFL